MDAHTLFKLSRFKSFRTPRAFAPIGVALWFTLTTTAWANFDAGLAAFGEGRMGDARVEWQKCAHEGHQISQFLLGQLYEEGQGIEPDMVLAHKWYCLAATNGYEEAISYCARIESSMTEEQKKASYRLLQSTKSGARTDTAPSGAEPELTPDKVPASASAKFAAHPAAEESTDQAPKRDSFAPATADAIATQQRPTDAQDDQVNPVRPVSPVDTNSAIGETAVAINSASPASSDPKQTTGAVSESKIEPSNRPRDKTVKTKSVKTKSVKTKSVKTNEIAPAVEKSESNPAAKTTVETRSTRVTRDEADEDLRVVQKLLGTLGHYTGSPDGLMGRNTRLAIVAFKKQVGMPADDKIDSNTMNAIRKHIASIDGELTGLSVTNGSAVDSSLVTPGADDGDR